MPLRPQAQFNIDLWVYTTVVNKEWLRGRYNPYTKEQWEKIKFWWDMYKDSVGLEGELYMSLKKTGIGEEMVLKKIEEYRKKVATEREVWNNLRHKE